MKTIRISAKCVDSFTAILEENGNGLGEHYGEIPGWFPNDCNEYIELEIDITTGHILNWVTPTKSELENTFGS